MGAPEISIDESALLHNFRLLKRAQNGLPLAPVIKANAYGHGAKLIADSLEKHFSENDLPYFCVARLAEALELRSAFLSRKILVLSQFSEEDLGDFPENTEITLHSDNDVELLCALSEKQRQKILGLHLNINSGMNRLGWSGADLPKQILEAAKKLSAKGFKINGLMSHFACSEESSKLNSERQVEKFLGFFSELKKTWSGDFPKWIHIANSAAILNQLGTHAPFNMSRPGIHLWGVRHNSAQKINVELKPVLSVRAPIRQIFWVPKGEGIGYGHRFVAKERTLVGTICLGYADGVNRKLSRSADQESRLGFVVQGERMPIIGSVSMDLTMLDLTRHSKASELSTKTPHWAEWIGPHQGAEEIADALGTISYEVLCALPHRLARSLNTRGSGQ